MLQKEKALVAVKLMEMSDHGLQLIAKLPLVNHSFSEKEWQELISEWTEKIYNNEKLWLATDEVGFSIPKMNEKTIVIKGVFEMLEKPATMKKD